jgi:hypothetical protein
VDDFRVVKIKRAAAVELCKKHPHAPSMPNSAKIYFALYVNKRFRGLAAWGYGIMPKQMPVTLFGKNYSNNVSDYLELCRFFVDNDNVPQHSASKFLAITHRMLKKNTNVKWLFTYAAGFQGLIGTIYKASGYQHITPHETRLIYIPSQKALVHPISFWHRYSLPYRAQSKEGIKLVKEIYPGAQVWCGHNYRYLYFLCSAEEKSKLLETARFEFMPAPTKEDIKIWLEDENGFVEWITDMQLAQHTPIIKLKTGGSRGNGIRRPVGDRRFESDPAAPSLI